MRTQSLIFTLGQCCIASLAAPTQIVLGTSLIEKVEPRMCFVFVLITHLWSLKWLKEPFPRKLYGRFLHITDIHPDPFYEPGASQSSACHRTDLNHSPPAGYYGAPYRCVNYPCFWSIGQRSFLSSSCDAPFSLTNFTLDFLDEHWTSDIDFVICERLTFISVIWFSPICRI
jgi:endopolyphosphatase